MARKQVIVQLDDKLVAELDKAARQTASAAVNSCVAQQQLSLEARKVRKAEYKLVEVYKRVPQDPAFVEAARRLAAETAPDW